MGSLVAGCDGTRSAPTALHCASRCLHSTLSRRPKLRFYPEKINELYRFFAARGKNTFKLISNPENFDNLDNKFFQIIAVFLCRLTEMSSGFGFLGQIH